MNKQILIIIVITIQLSFALNLSAQVSINPSGNQPDPSAGLDVNFANKGFLPPRVALTAINSPAPITSPAAGLLVYNTANAGAPPNNVVAGYYYWNGVIWVSMVVPVSTNAHYVGESYGGGIVFYVYDGGQHGLIAPTSDQSAGIRWYGGTNTYTCAKGNGVGAGLKNTAIIIANQGNGDGTTYAARLCNEYSVTIGDVTFGDWYLPSSFELNLLYMQQAVVGGFSGNNYWSSSEAGYSYVFYQNFSSGFQGIDYKVNTFSVRAIRAF